MQGAQDSFVSGGDSYSDTKSIAGFSCFGVDGSAPRTLLSSSVLNRPFGAQSLSLSISDVGV